MDDQMPHPHQNRSRFDSMAERAAQVTSEAPFFMVSLVLLAAWVPTLWILGSETSQFLIQTVTAIVTFLLVALLENSQHRSEQAVNIKLNAIAQGIADLMRSHAGEDEDLRDNIARLAATVGLEERVTTARKREGKNAEAERDASNGQQPNDDEAAEAEAGASARS
jgi:low affinity Fe/Cu permease